MKYTKILKMPDNTVFDALLEGSPTFDIVTENISYNIEHHIKNVELNALAHDYKGKATIYHEYDLKGQHNERSLKKILPSIAEGEYEKITHLRTYAKYLGAAFYTEATFYKALLRWCADHYDFFINKAPEKISIYDEKSYKILHKLYPDAYTKDLKRSMRLLEDVMNEEGTVNLPPLPPHIKAKIIDYVSFEYIYGLPNPERNEDFDYNTYCQEFLESIKQN